MSLELRTLLRLTSRAAACSAGLKGSFFAHVMRTLCQIRHALRDVKAVYPAARFDLDGRGMTLDQSAPPIAPRRQKWIGSLPHDPFISLPDSGRVPVLMRRNLISKILSQDHPARYGCLTEPRLFEKFRVILERNLQTMSPRSSCERAFDDMGAEIKYSEEGKSLISGIMTYANEAFHLSMAAYLADTHGMDVKIETVYSDRFKETIPYKTTVLAGDTKAEIKVPISAVRENKNGVINRLFEDNILGDAREKYINNPSSETRARTYEKAIYDAIGMPFSLSEFTKSIGDKIDFVSIVGSAAAVNLIWKMMEKKISRRGMLWSSFEKMLVISGLTFGIEEAAKHETATILENGGTGLIASEAAQMLVITGVDQTKDHSSHLERVLRMLRDISGKECVKRRHRVSCACDEPLPGRRVGKIQEMEEE